VVEILNALNFSARCSRGRYRAACHAEIAQLLSISPQHLYDILRERKPVSPAVVVRLGKLFGDGAGVWVRMQAAYDTWNAEREEDVSKIPTLRVKAA
jgi:antitoxin HigA-1